MHLREAKVAILVLMFLAGTARAVDSDGVTSQPSLSDAAQTLVLQLGDADPAIRTQAEQRLTDMGTVARPALLLGARNDSPQISSKSRELLQTLPWDIETDPPAVRSILANYGQRETPARMQVIRQLFELRNGAGYAALARLIVEDPDPAVQWKVAETFRESPARLSTAQARQLALSADNPAALCLAGWSCQQTNFNRAAELYELAIHDALQRRQPCLEGLAPVYETLVGLKRFNHDYDGAAELLRSEWMQALREAGGDAPDSRPLDELFALHAMHGPLPGFARDLAENPEALIHPQTLYAMGKMCENRQHPHIGAVFYAVAYSLGIGSPETREAAGEFLLEQNWPDLAQRELVALAQSWFAGGATIDSANMRLGLLHANLGHDQQAAKYLAMALPGLHARSVWLSLQHGDRHYYGRSAEKYLWTLQHFHAMRFALAQHDDEAAQKQAIEIAKLGTDDEDFVLATAPVLQTSGHPNEASSLFEQAYKSAKTLLDESPNDPRQLNNVAWLCAVCRQRLDEALPLAQRAARLSPDDANVLDTLAEVQFALGHRDEAIATAQHALRVHPESAYLHQQLAKYQRDRRSVEK